MAGLLLATISSVPSMHAQPVTFTTFAGLPAPDQGSEDGTGSKARFSFPDSVATDSSGNVYVTDSDNHTLRKISPAGAVTTLAGLAGVSGSADGTGSAARFHYPQGVATDSSGNVYVADRNDTIRKITMAGVVTTLAGVARTSGSADGTGSAARFHYPQGVATDSSGNIYVADGGNETIRKITPAGAVTTLAGLAGESGSADGTGSAARFNLPYGVATDSSGNVYVADSGSHSIRKITPAGAVTTLAGLAETNGSADGTGSAARFNKPYGVVTDSSGNVYVADRWNQTIRKINPMGVVTTLAGRAGFVDSADGIGSGARFSFPSGLAADGSGNVYVADQSNHTVRKITPAGVVTTLAGLSRFFGGRADGTGSAAQFNRPHGVATDSSGNIYVADRSNNTIRKITPAGSVTTLAGLAGTQGSADGTGIEARFNRPHGVATDGSGNVYVADTNNGTIRRISPAGAVTTLAGLAGASGRDDGTGSAARFSFPTGVATDGSGNVYVADESNYAVRKVTPAGVVITLPGKLPDSFRPEGIAADRDGNVYVASATHTILKITPAGDVDTLAGVNGFSGWVDGTGSAARFSSPSGVTIDSSGNIYVADTGNSTIRKITPARVVTTLGGLARFVGSFDGTGSAARFFRPVGIGTDGSGNLFVADTENNTIRIGKTALGDAATIDISSGSVGATRQLGTSSVTATSWIWSVIRRPVGSVALLSSANVGNPTFTPDVPGLFTFRLLATNASGARLSTVSLGVDIGTVPRITAADALSIVSGTASFPATIATVIDAEDSSGTLRVTATSDPVGVTVAGIANTNGTITASLAVSCDSTVGASTVMTLLVTDSVGLTSTANLTVNVTANPPPVVGRYQSTTARLGRRTVASPSFPPSDDGGPLKGFTARASGFTGSLTGNQSTGSIDISNPGPPGSYLVTVLAEDNCFARTTSTFVLTVIGPPGDVNGDDTVSVADIFYLISSLFSGGPTPIGSGDVNGDSIVTVADIFFLIDFLFSRGLAPV